MKLDRRHAKLATTAILAIGVPAGAAAYVGQRTREVAEHLGAAAGVRASIGGIDADLTGRIRLTDVALGELFQADAIEASVALDSLLSGQLGADEIRVAGPRVAIAVDRDGDSDLARLVRRLAHANAPATSGDRAAPRPTRLRRIVVSSGSLVAHIAGIGDLSADGVELVPDAGGVRVITGRLRLEGSTGQLSGELVLARSAAEVALPRVKFGRVLAVAGTGQLTAGGHTIPLRDVALGRLRAGGPLEVRASLDDGGVAREVAAQVPTPSGDEISITVRGDRVPLRAFASLAPRGLALADAHATGTLALSHGKTATRVAVDGTLDGARIDHPTVGAQPIAVSVGIRGDVALTPAALTIEQLALDVGSAHWTASGLWHRDQPAASGQLDIALAPAQCMDLLASVPTEIRGPLDGMTMTGTFGGRARIAVDLAAPTGDGVKLDTDLDNHCTVQIEPPAGDATQLQATTEQVFADGSKARVGKGTQTWTDIRRLPWYVPAAWVSAEDARFYDHHGFDANQIAKSFEIDLRDHRLARGGSTISQQLVKNAFLTQRRTLDRKLQEAILTWRLEARLDKRTILERYLNVIELGPHLFGIGAAAKYWFGVSARELTLREAAFLAALTSEPRSMSRRIRHAQGLDADSATRVDVILRAMVRDGVLPMDDYTRAHDAPLPFSPAAMHADQ